MWHELADTAWGMLATVADDPTDTPSPTTGVVAIITAVAGLLTALGLLLGAAGLAWRRFRGGDDDEDGKPPAPAPPPGGPDGEPSWVTWTQRRMTALDEERMAAQQVAHSAVASAERAHEDLATARAELTTLRAECERRERFLRRGLDPDTGEPLSPGP